MDLLTREAIQAMQNVDIRTVDRDSLRDIRDVRIDTELPKQERVMDFIRQIGNPYCYKCGKFIVRAQYAEDGVSLEDCLKSILL